MRTLNRNKVTYYYALYEKRVPRKDEYGNKTGEYDIQYSKPVKARANISSAQGQADVLVFGNDISYDKTIVTEKTELDENSILWIDRPPAIKDDGTTDTPHDYIVKKVAKSLNSVTIAVSKVKVQ